MRPEPLIDELGGGSWTSPTCTVPCHVFVSLLPPLAVRTDDSRSVFQMQLAFFKIRKVLSTPFSCLLFFQQYMYDKSSTSFSHVCIINYEPFYHLISYGFHILADCNNTFRNSLFLVGEIGGNDYNYPFLQERALDEIMSYVPRVMDAISSAITALIELGARTLVVPGNFPIGCNSAYLTVYRSPRSEDYDAIGCIKWLNKFSRYHNNQLRVVLNRIRRRHPYATVIYADYYSAAMSLFTSPALSGFRRSPLPACCGGGGPYNYNSSILCGNLGSNICADPSSYITWDGMHLTEAAYRKIAISILQGPNAVPPILNTCPQTKQKFSRSQYVPSDDALDG